MVHALGDGESRSSSQGCLFFSRIAELVGTAGVTLGDTYGSYSHTSLVVQPRSWLCPALALCTALGRLRQEECLGANRGYKSETFVLNKSSNNKKNWPGTSRDPPFLGKLSHSWCMGYSIETGLSYSGVPMPLLL